VAQFTRSSASPTYPLLFCNKLAVLRYNRHFGCDYYAGQWQKLVIHKTEPSSRQFDFISVTFNARRTNIALINSQLKQQEMWCPPQVSCNNANITASLFISVINQLIAQNFSFTISLFNASTCFEHMCLSSGGQNCITQPLVSSHWNKWVV